jgi:hypothetical protein
MEEWNSGKSNIGMMEFLNNGGVGKEISLRI